jgi:hypothetical protein
MPTQPFAIFPADIDVFFYLRRTLNLLSRLWRDETNRPWLAVAPLIQMQRHPHQRELYPLSVSEQHLLFAELAAHLASMALSRSTPAFANRKY